LAVAYRLDFICLLRVRATIICIHYVSATVAGTRLGVRSIGSVLSDTSAFLLLQLGGVVTWLVHEAQSQAHCCELLVLRILAFAHQEQRTLLFEQLFDPGTLRVTFPYSFPYARDKFVQRMNQRSTIESLQKPLVGSQFENAVLGHIKKKIITSLKLNNSLDKEAVKRFVSKVYMSDAFLNARTNVALTDLREFVRQPLFEGIEIRMPVVLPALIDYCVA